MIKYRLPLPTGYMEFATLAGAEAHRASAGIIAAAEEVFEAEPFDAEAQVADAWRSADALARQYADENARVRYLLWLIDPSTTASIRSKIIAVQMAMDAIWVHYYTVVGTLRAGYPATFDPTSIPPCPHTFGEIAYEAMNP